MADFGDRPVGSPVQPCPLKQTSQPQHWVEIQLLGEDDSPLPDEEYEITLPNGDVVRGYLDEHGLARIEMIRSAGECQICFPRLDREAWQRKDGAGGRKQ